MNLFTIKNAWQNRENHPQTTLAKAHPRLAMICLSGLSIDYIPSSAPAEAEISYRFVIQSGSAPVGNNAPDHLLQRDNQCRSVSTMVRANGNPYLQQFQNASPVGDACVTGFAWSTGTYYDVTMQVGPANDLFSLQVNGMPVVTDYPLANDVQVPTGFHFGDNLATDLVQRPDDVLITPEPTTPMILAVGASVTLSMLRRRGAARP